MTLSRIVAPLSSTFSLRRTMKTYLTSGMAWEPGAGDLPSFAAKGMSQATKSGTGNRFLHDDLHPFTVVQVLADSHDEAGPRIEIVPPLRIEDGKPGSSHCGPARFARMGLFDDSDLHAGFSRFDGGKKPSESPR